MAIPIARPMGEAKEKIRLKMKIFFLLRFATTKVRPSEKAMIALWNITARNRLNREPRSSCQNKEMKRSF